MIIYLTQKSKRSGSSSVNNYNRKCGLARDMNGSQPSSRPLG